MEPQADYQNFLKMNKQQQIEYVQNAQHADPTPIGQFGSYPEYNFINLIASQDKKQIKLSTFRYPAQSQTKAVVIFLHGMGSHGGIAVNFAKNMSKNGITVIGYDQRGHGRSEGQRGYMDSSKQMLKDAKNFLTEVRKIYVKQPIFLMGQSLGSLFSFILAKQFKNTNFSGLILFSPSMKKPSNNKMIAAVSDFALKLMPNKTGIFQFKYENGCRNPTGNEFMKKDPLNYHGKVYSGSLSQILSLMDMIPQKSWDRASELPTVIIQGEMDKIVDPAYSINLYEKLKVKDKSFWWFPKMWNNAFLEPQSEEINQRIIKWIQSRI